MPPHVTISCTAATSNANWQESNDSTITTKVEISSLLLVNQKIHGLGTSELDVPNHPGLNSVRTLLQGRFMQKSRKHITGMERCFVRDHKNQTIKQRENKQTNVNIQCFEILLYANGPSVPSTSKIILGFSN